MLGTTFDTPAIMFFDVECANGCTYNLKELRRIMMKAIGTRVKELHVFLFGPALRRTPRISVVLHQFTDVDFAGIQQELLAPQGVYLQSATEPHVEDVVQDDPIDPTSIPITISVVPSLARA